MFQRHAQLVSADHSMNDKGWNLIVQPLLQVNKLAAVESQGSEKGEHIAVKPANCGIDRLDASGPVIVEYGFGQLFANAVAHEFRVDPYHGDPGAFVNTETYG